MVRYLEHFAMSTYEDIFFGTALDETVTDLLTREQLHCGATATALVELVFSLFRYREEGVALFPRVFICNDITAIRRLLPGGEYLPIDTIKRSPDIARKALKHCAALAQGCWAIYIERKSNDTFTYGIFRSANLTLSLLAEDILFREAPDLSAPISAMPVVMVGQLSEQVVEIRGAFGARLHIHASAGSDKRAHPGDALEHFVDAAVRDVAGPFQQQTKTFLLGAMSPVLQAGHGALGAVLARPRRIPKKLQDGVTLSTPIDLVAKITDYAQQRDEASIANLSATALLIDGMLTSDGITIFSTDARMLGYRIFIKAGEPGKNQDHKPVVGGARRRAFEYLSSLVKRHQLVAAFYRSQDGQTYCERTAR